MDGIECDLHAPDLVRLACVRNALQEFAQASGAGEAPCSKSDVHVPGAWTAALGAAILAAGVSLASVWWATRGTWRRTQTPSIYDADEGDDASRS